MIGLIFATSIFFFSYRGYDWKDRLFSIIQAITVLGVIVFPNYNYTKPYTTGIFCLPSRLSHTFHCITAGTFFITIALNLLLLFTKTGKEPTEKKKLRNKIYKICGILILVAAFAMFILSNGFVKQYLPKNLPVGMICEFVMFTSFGFAYLVKSEAIKRFNDDYENEKVVTEIDKPVSESENIDKIEIDEKPEEPTLENPSKEEKPEVSESVIGFFQKIGIIIDTSLEIFKKKKK